jgi:feruloyl-CoA synthase
MDSLERWACLAPDRVLVARRDRAGDWKTVSYAQMLKRVRRAAAALITRGLSAERPIVILSGNSIEHLTLAFAATWAGIPHCSVSPSYSQSSSGLQRLRSVLDLLTPGLVAAFDSPSFARALKEVDGCSITQLGELDADPTEKLDQAHARTGPDSVVKFALTSGSTGRPKAVVTTERMLCSNALMLLESMPFLADEPPVILDWLPWSHTFGGSHNVGLVLFNGGSLFIDDGRPTAQGFDATVRNLHEISPTVYFNVPRGFDLLASRLEQDQTLRHSFYRNLQACFYAAASLPQHIWDRLDAAALAEIGTTVPMLSSLGATETGPAVTFTTPSMARSGVIGLPAAGNLIKLTPCDGKLEIRVRSPSVTPGYWREPELTAAAFDEEGFYRLGDAVRMIDGDDPTRGLIFDGRIAEDFKLATGTWVSVGPLRARLIAALAPLIQDVVIAGIDQDYIGALLIPDLRECQDRLGLLQQPTFHELHRDPRLLALLRDCLHQHGMENPASSTRVQRALVMPVAPSLDQGEVTDKGSVNQKAVLKNHTDLVSKLYRADAAEEVIRID